MKIKIFFILMVAFLTAAAGLMSCGNNSSSFTTISVSPKNAAVAQGTTLQFGATEAMADNSMTLNMTKLVSWSSSNNAIATIDASGLATGVSAGGPVTITATDTTNHISATAQLSVAAAPIANITINPLNQTIARGATLQFAAAWNGGLPDITKVVSWSSSNNTIATIDANGLATANATNMGTVNIIAIYTSPSGATTTESTTLTVN